MLGKKKKGIQISIRNRTYKMLEGMCEMHGRTKSEMIDIAIMTLFGIITEQIKVESIEAEDEDEEEIEEEIEEEL